MGSEAAVYKALQQGVQAAADAGNISGAYKIVVDVGSHSVTVTGKVIEGVARIGSAYIP